MKILISILLFAVSLTASAATDDEVLSKDIDKNYILEKMPQSPGIANNAQDASDYIDPGVLQGVSDQEDIMLTMLRKLIGDPVVTVQGIFTDTGVNPDRSNPQVTVITKTLTTLSVVALTFSSAIILFVLFGALINQARYGTFLGKWDSWFVPMRIGISNTLLIPIPQLGGLNGIQSIVIALFLLGNGAANYVASIFVERAFSEAIVTPKMNTENIGFAKDVINAQICTLAYKEETGELMALTSATSRVSDNFWTQTKSFLGDARETQEFVFSYRSKSNPIDTCGETSERKVFYSDAGDRSTGEALEYKMITEIKPKAYQQLHDDLLPVSTKLFQVYKKESDYDKATQEVILKTISLAGQRFNNTLLGNINSSQDKIQSETYNEALNTFKRGGWSLLGLYYWIILNRQDTIQNSYYENGSAEHENFRDIEIEEVDARNYIAGATFLVDSIPMPESPLTLPSPQSLSEEGGSIQDWASSHLQSIFIKGFEYVAVRESGGVIDPMLTMRSLGNMILSGAVMFYKVAGIAYISGSAVRDGGIPLASGGGGAVVAGIEWLLSTIGIIVMATIGIGFILAVIVPMMPFVFMFMAIIGMLIYFLEALAGANFWMADHAQPEGNDFYGKAGHGYGILLNLTLRPLLIVVGFIFGYAIFIIGAWFFMYLYGVAFAWMTYGGVSFGMSTLFGWWFVFAGTLLALGYKSFQLTYELPNFVLRWRGTSDHSDMGEDIAKQQLVGMAIGGGGISQQIVSSSQNSATPSAPTEGKQPRGDQGNGENPSNNEASEPKQQGQNSLANRVSSPLRNKALRSTMDASARFNK